MEKIEIKNKEYFLKKKPKTTKISNGYILPVINNSGGVLDENLNFVEQSSYHNTNNFVMNINHGYEIKKEDNSIIYRDVNVIYIGHVWKHWGHFIHDVAGKLWVISKKEYKSYKIAFSIVNNDTIDGNFLRFFELLGKTKNDLIVIDKTSRFKEIIIPESSNVAELNYYTKEYVETFNTIINNTKKSAINLNKNIYFSRSNTKITEIGEEYIEKQFLNNEYMIIHPEKLKLDDLINSINNASTIVCLDSSICLNSVFLRRDTKWVVLKKYSAIHKNAYELFSINNTNVEWVKVYNNKFNIYGNKIGSLPYLVGYTKDLKRYFEKNGLLIKKQDYTSRIKDIFMYLYYCVMFKMSKVKHEIRNCIKYTKKNLFDAKMLFVKRSKGKML